jgi:ATP-dependent DNA ligase
VFNLMRRRRSGLQAVLCAFDLLELDDEEVRWLPIEERKRMLARCELSGGCPFGPDREL